MLQKTPDPIANAKFNLPVKQRTSLKDLFYVLNDNERQEAVDLLLKSYNEDTPLFKQTADVLTLGEWLKSLPISADSSQMQDLLSIGEIDNGKSYGPKDFNDFQYFGVNRSTDIGYDKQEAGNTKMVQGALLEIRDMKRQIPPDEWKKAAHCVADAVKTINQVTEDSPK